MARRIRKPKLADLPVEPDASAELDGALFLTTAGRVLEQLKADLLARAKGSAAVTRALGTRYRSAKEFRQPVTGTRSYQELYEFVDVFGLAGDWTEAFERPDLARHEATRMQVRAYVLGRWLLRGRTERR